MRRMSQFLWKFDGSLWIITAVDYGPIFSIGGAEIAISISTRCSINSCFVNFLRKIVVKKNWMFDVPRQESESLLYLSREVWRWSN